MNVTLVPCLFDNYAYLLADEVTKSAVIVDPSESVPVLRAIEAAGLEPVGVLCTHHHGDHIGGLPDILKEHAGLQVFAHERDAKRIPGLTGTVRDKDEIEVGPFAFRALHVPGHTLGAVTWVSGDVAFTGDTLFAGGCGRVFEGTAQMMYASLNEVLAKLAPSTRVYCGHEYTESNLRFARHVEPGNEALARRFDHVQETRARKEPTIPSTVEEELATNPFLRCSEPGVVEFAREHDAGGVDPVSVFAAIRAAKNQFRG